MKKSIKPTTKMKHNNNYLPISIILPIGLLFLGFMFSQWQTFNEDFDDQVITTNINKIEKQKGVHLFGRIDATSFPTLTRNNIEWVTLVAWSSQDDWNSPMVDHYYGDSLRMRQRDSSWLERMEMIHSAGFKIFLKPHVWIDEPTDGKWRSDIFPTNEENWQLWKTSYRDFILRYAILAEKAEVEMFCIGTEFSRLSVEKLAFWKTLIQEVRGIYSGKITYAANWYNEYEKINFWEDLDYIGVQAYFPLTRNKNPTVKQISKGWKKHLSDLKSIHKKYNLPILFTEMGYKSTADSAINPWEWIDNFTEKDKAFSPETQANCYQAFFDTVWKKDWFAGVHIWQLRTNYRRRDDGQNKLDFTPLGKPAERVIAKGFSHD